MAKIHVIYDPRDRIERVPGMEEQLGLRVAVMSIEHTDPVAIRRVVTELAEMLMRELHEAREAKGQEDD